MAFEKTTLYKKFNVMQKVSHLILQLPYYLMNSGLNNLSTHPNLEHFGNPCTYPNLMIWLNCKT
jgi:hypothetical protein